MDMDNYNEYRKHTYKDAGVEKGFTTKALISILALILALALTLTSCGSSAGTGTASVTSVTAEATDNAVSKSKMFTERDLSGDYDESEAETITLSGSSAETSAASGVTISGSTITITAEGVYIVSGSLDDGQIIVDTDDSAKVQIVLKDASVTSSDSAALYVKSADKVFVTLAEGTENTLANGGSFIADGDTNIDGAVFAKDDIVFNGSGSLIIDSPAGHGIAGNDDVKFAGGTYTINAAEHGVKANDSVRVAEADVTIVSGADKDGIHVSDDADEEEGTGSDSFFYMADGSLTISAGDDGIHADASVIIEGGTIAVSKSYEGIEGLSISISGGSTTVIASDDGLNAGSSIEISGGNVHITAGGDGIDSNGSVAVSGGYTVVEGPSQGDTSVLDFNGTASITGGTFIGTGGAGMGENFTDAEQGLITVNVGSQSAGSTVTLRDASGNVIAEIAPGLDYAAVYISAESMAQGETYTLTAGSYSESITLTDIIYSTINGGMTGVPGGGQTMPGGNTQGGMPQGGPGQGERP